MCEVAFTVNGKHYSVLLQDGSLSLNTFLRKTAQLSGTKVMCREGGCGSCVVAATIVHPVYKKPLTYAVNSCLVPVLSCHEWDIKTVEGIGDRLHGYHPVQKRLAQFSGTQCGFCSSGFVMNMYSLLESRKNNNLTMAEIENSFASNICRCTGYRPIADAFKSFAKDAESSLKSQITDIEDLGELSLCKKTGQTCTKTCDDYSEDGDFCIINVEIPKIRVNLIGVQGLTTKWFRVSTIDEIFRIFENEGSDSYRFVGGNTGQGVVSMLDRIIETPRIMIDISKVEELRQHNINASLIIGGGMPLQEIMELLLSLATMNEFFSYGYQMYRHMDLVAHIPVRNIGTLAGNLAVKHKHREFASDMFLLLETLGATLKIVDKYRTEMELLPSEFLKVDLSEKVICSANLPPLSNNYHFVTYKIMKRAQNAHAMVNAGFLLKINSLNIIQSATIVYGGISPDFIHADHTERFLIGKNIFNDRVLKLALQCLNDEIFPVPMPPEPSTEYRKKLAIGLFYRCILCLSPNGGINPRFITGMEELKRPLSSGKQEFDTQPEKYPVGKPIPKLEALEQCTGEAKYIDDLPTLSNEAFGVFVLSTIAVGEILEIDVKGALKIPGVIAVFTAKDIPGENNFTPFFPLLLVDVEEVLCSGNVKYNGQPLALVVAESEVLAQSVALTIKVTYTNSNKTPKTDLRDILKDPKESYRIKNYKTKPAKRKDANVTKIIKGTFDVYQQYHYTLETQSCVCVPIENGLDVYSSTQWIDWTQYAISKMLTLPKNKINLVVRRIGGAYGGKISRSQQTACACALAAYKLDRPIRVLQTIESNMQSVGKRLACSSNYEVGVDDEGRIQYLTNDIYEDFGSSPNDQLLLEYTIEAFSNCYDDDTWTTTISYVLTDSPSHTWFRAPGTTESVAMAEQIMDHIATETGKERLQVRLVNMKKENNPIPGLITTLSKNSMYNERETKVMKFNLENRWKKKGVSLIPMRYFMRQFGNSQALVSILNGDGTVIISHSGIEMGQGINTKVAQSAAFILKVPLESVAIKPATSITTPNAFLSGSSITSETCCRAVIRACEMLAERLAPIRAVLPGADWLTVVNAAFFAQINLTVQYLVNIIEMPTYDVYGVAATEVELDVITGKYQVLRVDILEEVGDSISPIVDVGQIEGGYVMGLGYWTSEEIIYDKHDGALLTKRTWDYKPPGLKDIPVDFRVQFRHRSSNPVGVLGSKATGEPGTCLAYGFVSAMRQAITSARSELGIPVDKWYDIHFPLTPENALLATNTNIDSFTLQ